MIMNNRKGRKERVEEILANLVDAGKETAELLFPLVAKFISSYQTSYKNARARITGDTYYLEKKAREKRQEAEHQRFRSSLQYLKQCGFVKGERKGRSVFWSLTEKGRSHYDAIRTRRMRYEKERSDKTLIVSYDIPEYVRGKRDWAREVLKFLDFFMVHKSVWVGNNKIPEDFLHDLKRKEIFVHFHIFEVGKMGTLLKLE